MIYAQTYSKCWELFISNYNNYEFVLLLDLNQKKLNTDIQQVLYYYSTYSIYYRQCFWVT